jgi:hypothetical protein
MRLGKVVKSNSHCDYVVQLDGDRDVIDPPSPDKYGFGSFVKLEEPGVRHWAVGLIYNSLLDNPMFASTGPRLTSETDLTFTPDLVNETRTLLGVVLIGSLLRENGATYGIQGIPRTVVPINTLVSVMDMDEIYRFHRDASGNPQFCYYSLLLCYGGNFAAHLVQQVLQDLARGTYFSGAEKRAIEVLGREMSWKNTMGTMR